MMKKVDKFDALGFLFIKPFLMLLLFLMISTEVAFCQSEPQLGKDHIKDVIRKMTLQEKADLVVGMGIQLTPNVPDSIKKKCRFRRQKNIF